MEVESCELRMKLWAAQVPDGLRRMFVENQGDHETDGEGEQCEQGVLWKRHRLRDVSMACRRWRLFPLLPQCVFLGLCS